MIIASLEPSEVRPNASEFTPHPTAERVLGVAPNASAKTSALGTVWAVFVGLATVVYPLIVWFGLTRWSGRTVGLLMLACVLPTGISRLSRATPATRRGLLGPPVAIAGLVGLTVVLDDHRFLLALPVAINLVLLGWFGASLRGAVPTVERFARLQVSDLSPAEVRYCRSVTVVWCDASPACRAASSVGASGVTHPLMAEAATQFQAQAFKELLPSDGPVRCQVVGKETADTIKQANRVRDFMNYQIMDKMEEYTPEFDQMLFQLPLAGSSFKKIYQCPNTH